jgi:hypothetical protein
MDYFGEKTHQISEPGITAFGIPLLTRYGKADEMAEMLRFAQLAAVKELHELVKEVFYDSQACLCTIELHDDRFFDTEFGDELKACALKTIRQFQWDGDVFHGADLLDPSEF